MFLGLPDPDPVVRDPDPDLSLFSYTKFLQKINFFLAEDDVPMYLWASYEKKL